MPITEIALLGIKSDSISDRVTIRKHLEHAARSQATWSKHAVTLLECHEDPKLVYLIGGWDCVAQHMDEWIPGPINQDLLRLLEDDIGVKWMFHMDCDPDGLRGKAGDESRVLDGAVVAIGRHFVKDGQVKDFGQTWKENVGLLDEYMVGDGQMNWNRDGGWRLDVGYDPERSQNDKTPDPPNELVLFTAWPDVQKHLDFAETEAFKKYGKIRQYMSGAEVRHGKVLYKAEP